MKVAPMLAVAGPLPSGDDWAYELKWDGIRAIAIVRQGLRLYARSGADVTGAYPELAGLAEAVPDGTVLDGEVVAFDRDGRPSFTMLAERIHVREPPRVTALAAQIPVTYMIFDILTLAGEDLAARGYGERRAVLEGLGLAGPRWLVPPSFRDGPATLAAAAEHSLEGVVAKRLTAGYHPGLRSPDWVKVKREQTDEFVVGGWRPGERRLGALLVGVAAEGGLDYRGRVGGGISGAAERTLLAALEPLRADGSPFTSELPREDAKGATWVRPELVVEVRYGNLTPDGRLRFPRFLRLRPDKAPAETGTGAAGPPPQPAAGPPPEAGQPPRPAPTGRSGPGQGAPEPQATRVRVAGRTIELSNLDKVLYPETGFTKGEVIEYYTRVADLLLPHLRDRPLTRIRFPNGVTEASFFEKNAPAGTPRWVRTETLPVPGSSTDRETLDFVIADDLPTLVWLANLAALELHTPQWRIESAGPTGHGGPAMPDLLVLDLDPGPPAGLAECARVAVLLRDRLAADGFTAVAKTSGRKGMQLYCPVAADRPADAAVAYTKRVAEELARAHPRQITASMAKRLRPGKVFIDWSQNSSYKTTVAPYSLRAGPTPTVSAPLTWDEVGAGAVAPIGPGEMLSRVDTFGDLLADLATGGGPSIPE